MKIGGQRIPGKTLLLITSEGALIGLGLLFATALRLFDAEAFRQQLAEPGVLLRYSIVVVVCELALYYCDLYDLQIVSRRSVLFVRLLQALGAACLILALLYFWDPDLSLGRGVAVIAAPIIITLVVGWRLLVDASAPLLRRSERILIVGDGPAGRSLAESIIGRPELNIHVVGFLSEQEPGAAAAEVSHPSKSYLLKSSGPRVFRLSKAMYTAPLAAAQAAGSGALSFRTMSTPTMPSNSAVALGDHDEQRHGAMPPVLGGVMDVEQVATVERVERVVLSFSERRRCMPLNPLLRLKFIGLNIEEAHNMYERITGRILLDHLAPSWLILSDGFHQPPIVLAAKRFLDLLISVLGVIITAPLMALVALAIFLEDGRPILFRQERIGLGSKHFQILKFRSMRNETVQKSARWTSDRDPRITRVGGFIRKVRLDELPQLINVLRGDMSLVGPRPEQPLLAEMLEENLPYYAQRHSLRPGITGWAQVKYGYGATVEETKIKLEHDLFYIKHLSIALDFAIMFETGKVLLSGRGAK
jgi:exopolysaccharide biosynthesis polyprenyl glycosylphosphotransferase